MESIKISWLEIDNAVDTICKEVETVFPECSGIYGLPRGGLVPAVMLSHKLGLPLLAAPAKNCLVVDDIADTGKTLQHYSECGYKIATVFWKLKSIVKPDFYGIENRSVECPWLVFPWEDC
jgi:uncharacterized protein